MWKQRSGGPRRVTAVLGESLEPRLALATQPFAPGNTVVDIVTNYGEIWVELFDTATPQTVTNFLRYVDADRYDNTFIHRHVRDFVIQGGGYALDSGGTPAHIDEFTSVPNEFGISNKIKTVAMAKQEGNPNSATSEFFFNLGDNSQNLDNQNGGFTVFGQVVNGWDVVQKIANLSLVNAGSPFDTLPIRDDWQGPTITSADLVNITDVKRITSPGWSQEAASTSVVRGAGSAAGQSMFVTVNELGRPIAFYQGPNSTTWTVGDIGLQSDSPTLAGNVSAWFDTKDSRFYAAAPTAAGLVLYTPDDFGFWSARNLSTETSGSVITSDIVVFKTVDGFQAIAGITAAGHLVLFQQSSLTPTGGKFPWSFVDLQTHDLEPRGQTTPAFVGQLTAYVTSWNGLNIAGLDASGDIHSVWWAPDQTSWQTNNISDLTGAPPISGVLTSYVAPWDGLNLSGTNSSGELVVTWWAPDRVSLPNGGWATNNLTDLIDGPKLAPLSVSSYVTPWGGMNVAGLDENGKIVIYWWAPDRVSLPNGGWTTSPISDLVPNSEPPVGSITGVASPSGTISLVGRRTDGAVLRHYWTPGDANWSFENLTSKAAWV